MPSSFLFGRGLVRDSRSLRNSFRSEALIPLSAISTFAPVYNASPSGTFFVALQEARIINNANNPYVLTVLIQSYLFCYFSSAPCSLFPVPCSLFPAPCSLFPAPCSLFPALCSLCIPLVSSILFLPKYLAELVVIESYYESYSCLYDVTIDDAFVFVLTIRTQHIALVLATLIIHCDVTRDVARIVS